MKNLILAALCAASLAGCAQVAPGAGPVSTSSVSPAQLQANWMQACLAYEGAQKAAIANIGKLNNSQLQTLLITTHQITPICLKQPTDLNAATAQITAAVTTITILGAAQATGNLK